MNPNPNNFTVWFNAVAWVSIYHIIETSSIYASTDLNLPECDSVIYRYIHTYVDCVFAHLRVVFINVLQSLSLPFSLIYTCIHTYICVSQNYQSSREDQLTSLSLNTSLPFFDCFPNPDTVPHPTVQWRYNGAPLDVSNTAKYHVNPRTARLFISVVTVSDKGQYLCTLSNLKGSVGSGTGTLTVLGTPGGLCVCVSLCVCVQCGVTLALCGS